MCVCVFFFWGGGVFRIIDLFNVFLRKQSCCVRVYACEGATDISCTTTWLRKHTCRYINIKTYMHTHKHAPNNLWQRSLHATRNPPRAWCFLRLHMRSMHELTLTHLRTRKRTCTHARTRTHKDAYMHSRACTHIHTYTHMHTVPYKHVHLQAQVQTPEHAYTHALAHTHTHIHINTYTDTHYQKFVPTGSWPVSTSVNEPVRCPVRWSVSFF